LHLGRIKRRLYRLQLPPGDWRIGQPLRLSDGRSGRLVEVIRIGSGFEALAVLNVDSGAAESVADAPAAAADAPIKASGLPLPYELR
jgi:hypothetical protein